jgi:hypothetical protein
MAESVQATVLPLYEKQSGDLGPTLAAEQLAERDGITRSAATLRGWLVAKGVDHVQRRKRPRRVRASGARSR